MGGGGTGTAAAIDGSKKREKEKTWNGEDFAFIHLFSVGIVFPFSAEGYSPLPLNLILALNERCLLVLVFPNLYWFLFSVPVKPLVLPFCFPPFSPDLLIV